MCSHQCQQPERGAEPIDLACNTGLNCCNSTIIKSGKSASFPQFLIQKLKPTDMAPYGWQQTIFVGSRKKRKEKSLAWGVLTGAYRPQISPTHIIKLGGFTCWLTQLTMRSGMCFSHGIVYVKCTQFWHAAQGALAATQLRNVIWMHAQVQQMCVAHMLTHCKACSSIYGTGLHVRCMYAAFVWREIVPFTRTCCQTAGLEQRRRIKDRQIVRIQQDDLGEASSI